MSGAALQVSVVLAEHQRQEPAFARLCAGLTGQLALAEVIVAPASAPPGWLRGLVTLESMVFPPGGQAPELAVRDIDAGLAPCDVVVDLRPFPDRAAKLAEAARFGAWAMSCQDIGQIAAAVMAGDAAVDSVITCHGPAADAPVPVARTRIKAKTIVSLTHRFACEKTVQLLLHQLRRLALTGRMPGAVDAPGSGRPALGALPGYLWRVGGQALRRLRERIRPQHPFALRVCEGDIVDFDPGRGVALPSPAGSFCADPFLIETDSGLHVFCEEYPYATRRGEIAVKRLDGEKVSDLGIALSPGYHLSFPFLFEVGGALFMLPESLEAERLEVWRCTDFPLGWDRHAACPDAPRLADPVLYRQGDDWWLFGNSCHDGFGDFSSELSLYRVDVPDFTRFEPHPLNPVVVSSETARNAGRVFARDGRLYRLSQDNSGPRYGYGLNLMEIVTLTATDYAERRVRHFIPDSLAHTVGIHHADAVGGRVVFDVRKG